MAELPPPTYGYMRKDEFYTGSLDGNLLNEWVTYALRGMIYTEKIGRCMSRDTFICQIPWQGVERICAGKWHMGYTRGIAFKDGPWGKLAELQIDTIALQRGMLMGGNAGANCTEEEMDHNARSIRRTDERWEATRTEDADTMKKPLIKYKEWIAIEGGLRNLPIAEQEGAVSRWTLW